MQDSTVIPKGSQLQPRSQDMRRIHKSQLRPSRNGPREAEAALDWMTLVMGAWDVVADAVEPDG